MTWCWSGSTRSGGTCTSPTTSRRECEKARTQGAPRGVSPRQSGGRPRSPVRSSYWHGSASFWTRYNGQEYAPKSVLLKNRLALLPGLCSLAVTPLNPLAGSEIRVDELADCLHGQAGRLPEPLGPLGHPHQGGGRARGGGLRQPAPVSEGARALQPPRGLERARRQTRRPRVRCCLGAHLCVLSLLHCEKKMSLFFFLV